MLDKLLERLIAGGTASPHVLSGGTRLEVAPAAIGSGQTLSICRVNRAPQAKEIAIFRGSLKRIGWDLAGAGVTVTIERDGLNDWVGYMWTLAPARGAKPAGEQAVQPGLFG